MLKTRGEIKEWLHEMKIEKYTIHDDFTVDVNDTVDISQEQLIEIPIQFGVIKGNFDCGFNNLKSLKGCPHTVHGYFSCENNKLTTLEYSPKKIFGDFFIELNDINSLEHAPEFVSGRFDISHNFITSIKGFKTKLCEKFVHKARFADQVIVQCKDLYEKNNDYSYGEVYVLVLTPIQLQSIVLEEELRSELENNNARTNKKLKV